MISDHCFLCIARDGSCSLARSRCFSTLCIVLLTVVTGEMYNCYRAKIAMSRVCVLNNLTMLYSVLTSLNLIFDQKSLRNVSILYSMVNVLLVSLYLAPSILRLRLTRDYARPAHRKPSNGFFHSIFLLPVFIQSGRVNLGIHQTERESHCVCAFQY